MRVLTAVTAALVFLMIVSVGVFSSWYHDDQCMIAQWKCDAGTLSLFAMIVVGPFAALFTLVTLVALAVQLFGR